MRICILERGKEVLGKVKISGGGRCNLTHAEFVPSELVRHYPRGRRELLGPFHKFMTGDVMEWFEKRGVPLKVEEDGRVFPVSDSSQSVIDLFLKESARLGIELYKKTGVQHIRRAGDQWEVEAGMERFRAGKILIAAGSSTRIWKILEELGHSIIPGVPSLFTFNIKDTRITDLPGVSVSAEIALEGTDLRSQGPLLITHWGLSGPAVLKLSAWAARELSSQKNFRIRINWLPDLTDAEIIRTMSELREKQGKLRVTRTVELGLPRRLWQSLVQAAGIDPSKKWGDLRKKELSALLEQLSSGRFEVHGKSTFKEEFVTAGGVELKEVNLRTFESRRQPGLFLAGEVLNVDAVTGGFNFQNAWTGAFLAARAMTAKDPGEPPRLSN